jgi:hypothetical protein
VLSSARIRRTRTTYRTETRDEQDPNGQHPCVGARLRSLLKAYDASVGEAVLAAVILPALSIAVSIVVAYFTTTYTIRREVSYGRHRLLELTRRYLINLHNAFDRQTGEIKTTTLDHKIYVTELAVIVTQIEEAVRGPYLARLVTKHPSVSLLLVQLRRELVELQGKGRLESLNPGSVARVRDLYRIIAGELPRKATTTRIDTELNDILRIIDETGWLPPAA